MYYRAPFPEYASGASDFPYVFSEYAVTGAYGMWLEADSQFEKAQIIYAQAEQIIQSELDKLERQEGQTTPITYITHGTTAVSSA